MVGSDRDSRAFSERFGLRRRVLGLRLVCEDLARLEPVGEVLRSVGPTLVVALLMDGPQLSGRWPGRYATVLADDPGCAVLTLTSIGMAVTSYGTGMAPNRTIGLWKDPKLGVSELQLDKGSGWRCHHDMSGARRRLRCGWAHREGHDADIDTSRRTPGDCLTYINRLTPGILPGEFSTP